MEGLESKLYTPIYIFSENDINWIALKIILKSPLNNNSIQLDIMQFYFSFFRVLVDLIK